MPDQEFDVKIVVDKLKRLDEILLADISQTEHFENDQAATLIRGPLEW